MATTYDGRDDVSLSGWGSGSGWGGGWAYGPGAVKKVDGRKAAAPLLDHLRAYDALRLGLEREGGGLRDLARITEHLVRPITIPGNYGDTQVALTDQSGLRAALLNVGECDLHLDVRQLPTGMPVYYLCRIRRDYWSEYSLIVEDLYRSEGYPMADERFVRLMEAGHEVYYLRLAQLREPVKAARGSGGRRTEARTDELLYQAGRHIFQAAWHEDQRPGVLAATHFGLVHFRRSIELLYLCLSGELCELRTATNEELLGFFENPYPQPAIHAFLKRLAGMDGAAINEVPRKALGLYARLSSAFGRFLSMETACGRRRVPLPLYKVLFGNLPRLDPIAKGLKADPRAREAARRLEQESRAIVGELVGTG